MGERGGRRAQVDHYEAFDAHRDGWQELVADDVTFDAPIQKAKGKKEFVALTEQFLHFHKETHLLKRFEQGVPPIEFTGIRHGTDPLGAPVHHEGASLDANVAVEASVSRIVLQQVHEVLDLDQIIEGDYIDVVAGRSRAKDRAADPAKPIDAHSDP